MRLVVSKAFQAAMFDMPSGKIKNNPKLMKVKRTDAKGRQVTRYIRTDTGQQIKEKPKAEPKLLNDPTRKYFDGVSSDLNEQDTLEVQSVIKTLPKPVQSLLERVRPQFKLQRKIVNATLKGKFSEKALSTASGYYHRPSNELYVRVRNGVSARKMVDGLPMTAWSHNGALGANESMQKALIHELGHLILEHSPRAKVASLAFKQGNPLSVYAGTHPQEYFAESFVLYNVDKERLKAKDPMGFKMVLAVLRSLGDGK